MSAKGYIPSVLMKGKLIETNDGYEFKGKNEANANIHMVFTGRSENGKRISLNKENFINGIVSSINKSYDETVKRASQEKKIIAKETRNKRLNEIRDGSDITLLVENVFGSYNKNTKILDCVALGEPKSLSNNKEYLPVKPVYFDKDSNSQISISSTVKAMVAKRAWFKGLEEGQKENLIYNEDSAKNFNYKILSVTDVREGRYDPLTVSITANLPKISKSKDVLTSLQIDENYIDYVMKKYNKSFKPTRLGLDENSNTVTPKTSIYVPESEILKISGVSDLRELVSTVFKKANKMASEGERFFIPFENSSETLIVDESNINDSKVVNKDILYKTYKTILSEFGNSQSQMLSFVGVKNSDDLDFIKCVDKIHSAKSFDSYKKETVNLYKMINNIGGLHKTPIRISFPLSTRQSNKLEDENYLSAYKKEIKSLLTNIVTDITKPIENFSKSVLLSNGTSNGLHKLQSQISQSILINNEKLEYKKNSNGFELFDGFPLKGITSAIDVPSVFALADGKKFNPIGFTALKIPTSTNGENKKVYQGIKGAGGKNKFSSNMATNILSRLGISYVSKTVEKFDVASDYRPKLLHGNPITGEDVVVSVDEKQECSVENLNTESMYNQEENTPEENNISTLGTNNDNEVDLDNIIGKTIDEIDGIDTSALEEYLDLNENEEVENVVPMQ